MYPKSFCKLSKNDLDVLIGYGGIQKWFRCIDWLWGEWRFILHHIMKTGSAPRKSHKIQNPSYMEFWVLYLNESHSPNTEERGHTQKDTPEILIQYHEKDASKKVEKRKG